MADYHGGIQVYPHPEFENTPNTDDRGLGVGTLLRERVKVCKGFPEIRGTFRLGVPIIRTVVFGSLYWGPPILGNYHLHGSLIL